MSFAITEHGSRDKLIQHLKDLKENGVDGKPVEDQSLMDSARELAIARLQKLPDGCSVVVQLEGKTHELVSQVTVQVIGKKGHF